MSVRATVRSARPMPIVRVARRAITNSWSEVANAIPGVSDHAADTRERAGSASSGMGAIASYLGNLLARETRVEARQTEAVPV